MRADSTDSPRRATRGRIWLTAALVGLGACSGTVGAPATPTPDVPLRLQSPDGAVGIRIAIDASGTPLYSVDYQGRDVVLPSSLGLELRQGNLTSGMEVTGVSRNSHDETYPLVAGASRSARDHYNELTVSLRQKAEPGRVLQIVFRAYDDGAAFRYVLPRQPALDTFEITAERSTFRFAGDFLGWAANYGTYTSSYETEYKPTPLDSIGPNAIIGLPLALQTEEGIALALTEADLDDYAGMYVGGQGAPGSHTLVSKLSPLPHGDGVLVRATTPHDSPWRVLMLGRTPAALIESSLVLNLNPPSRIKDSSWIVPGKVLFPWWPDFRTEQGSPTYGTDPTKPDFAAPAGAGNRINFQNQKYYVDFAAEYGIPYIEMEPPWYGDEKQAIEQPLTMDITRPIPELRLPELLAYARERNVSFLMWAHWESVEAQMEQAFSQYEAWGVKGVKIDFMNRDDQEMVNWYHKVLESAARHHLVVYLHGAYKSTGLRRTWPNLLTREAVMGLEYNKWSHRSTPEHNVTLPFTRMLAGPMDYTPGGFTNVTPAEFEESYSRPMVMTSRAQQLAMFVVYLSPLQMVADWPGAYRGQPAAEFIRAVPTSWDETRVVTGKIGDYIAIARRRGQDWFLGAMTDATPRELQLPLGFLGSGRYRATIYADGPDVATQPTQVVISTRQVSASDTLSARLATGGGFAVEFSRLP